MEWQSTIRGNENPGHDGCVKDNAESRRTGHRFPFQRRCDYCRDTARGGQKGEAHEGRQLLPRNSFASAASSACHHDHAVGGVTTRAWWPAVHNMIPFPRAIAGFLCILLIVVHASPAPNDGRTSWDDNDDDYDAIFEEDWDEDGEWDTADVDTAADDIFQPPPAGDTGGGVDVDSDGKPMTCERCHARGLGWCFAPSDGCHGRCAAYRMGTCPCGPGAHFAASLEELEAADSKLRHYDLPIGCPGKGYAPPDPQARREAEDRKLGKRHIPPGQAEKDTWFGPWHRSPDVWAWFQARRDSAEDFSRMNARRCTTTD